jgi:K+-sensing histidine kinase KdpD
MPLSSSPSTEALLANLIHDLRQHLGTIETSVYCLNLGSDAKQSRTREYLRTIEQQVERAAGRLSVASAELTRMQAQREEALEIFDSTKSATSAVT